jgi:ribosome-associated translation inhibitor RaiA
MSPYVQVSFQGMLRDPSLEAAIHRWVARLGSLNVEIHRAEVAIERLGRRRTAVRVSIGSVDGTAPAAAADHADAYVAVSDAFRAVHRQLLPRRVARGRRPVLALAG